MKEMAATGHDSHREALGPGPVHHIGQRHGIVLLTMQYQRAVMESPTAHREAETAKAHRG